MDSTNGKSCTLSGIIHRLHIYSTQHTGASQFSLRSSSLPYLHEAVWRHILRSETHPWVQNQSPVSCDWSRKYGQLCYAQGYSGSMCWTFKFILFTEAVSSLPAVREFLRFIVWNPELSYTFLKSINHHWTCFKQFCIPSVFIIEPLNCWHAIS